MNMNIKDIKTPKWTVRYNIVNKHSPWIGTGWEFFDSEREAEIAYKKHIDLGNVPTKRPFHRACDTKHLGCVDRNRITDNLAKEILQTWEGIITEVNDESFCAELYDLINKNNPVELIEISIDEVPHHEHHLIANGAIFQWSIYYEERLNGQVVRVSEITLREEYWTQEMLDKIKLKADTVANAFLTKPESELSS